MCLRSFESDEAGKGAGSLDQFLIDYLRSGRAWLLVGSGPSTAMGYPSWRELAESALEAVRRDTVNLSGAVVATTAIVDDPPRVFERAAGVIGLERLRQALSTRLIPRTSVGAVYEALARWPVAVYLTTNYDNEIHAHLARIGQAFVELSNSEDHLAHLDPDASGLIVHLHGDLRSDVGLVLTSAHYRAAESSAAWDYWRQKLASIFQMNRVIVIGQSLTDANIRAILSAAKKGSGVTRPVCWIAPDVRSHDARRYLEDYRIRVVSYDNRGGDHRNLRALVDTISMFVPPRTAISLESQVRAVGESPRGRDAGAPAFFVFNRLEAAQNRVGLRSEVVAAALESVAPSFGDTEFGLDQALAKAGWPSDKPLAADLRAEVLETLARNRVVTWDGSMLRRGENAARATQGLGRFQIQKERFCQSLSLRVKRDFPDLSDLDAGRIAEDIESSLAGFFDRGGFTLAMTLFSNSAVQQRWLPSHVLRFISDASARYDNLLMRQAFVKVAIDAFAKAEPAEREYLGRLAQGFFAFHSLGAFGEVAVERVASARSTVWLIDSNALIPALAVGASGHAAHLDAFARLRSFGVRTFTTDRLFDEARDHFAWAANFVRLNGQDSAYLVAAAFGQAPYRKSNQFLEGFENWQALGNANDWESYLFAAFGHREPSRQDLVATLARAGVEVVDLQVWPGFDKADFEERDAYVGRISQVTQERLPAAAVLSPDELDRKALPEAEAYLIILRERAGSYRMHSHQAERSPAWFVSSTSVLNLVDESTRVTWQPEAFLSFAGTLFPADAKSTGSQAFDTLLVSIAQSGLVVVDEDSVLRTFGSSIDEETLKVADQRELYQATLAEKYGESLEDVLARVAPSSRAVAARQLVKEMAQTEAAKIRSAESRAENLAARLAAVEKKAKGLDHVRIEQENRKRKIERRKRQNRAK